MTRSYGLSTDVRELTEALGDQIAAYADAVEDAARDGAITRIEIARITRYRRRLTGTAASLAPKAAQLDDAHRVALPLLTLGMADAGRRNPGRVRDYERTHGPIDLEQYRRTHRPVDLARVRNAKKRRRGANHDDAA